MGSTNYGAGKVYMGSSALALALSLDGMYGTIDRLGVALRSQSLPLGVRLQNRLYGWAPLGLVHTEKSRIATHHAQYLPVVSLHRPLNIKKTHGKCNARQAAR
jgi:hypothetical protein